MSVSHHGDDAHQRELMGRFINQMNGTSNRAYPAGRMGADDDGVLSYAIAADPRQRKVVIRFGKPVEWIGLGIDDVVALRDALTERLLELRGITA